MSEARTETDVSVWEAHHLTKAEFDALPPSTRITLERTHHPKAPDARRQVLRDLTPEELTLLDEQTAREGLSWAARRERARQWQQTPAPGPDAA